MKEIFGYALVVFITVTTTNALMKGLNKWQRK